MRRVMAQVERVAASETRVCILGETGTGKELVARTLHERSPRAGGPFITLNCAAVPAELIESELFGHEKGSFTGAAGRHIGKFEQAERGTIFLDEIGDMPLHMQAKLLRVLEEGEVERIGGDKPIAVDVRVVGRDPSRSGSPSPRREIPPGSVSPNLRFPSGAAPAARAAGRHSGAGRAFCSASLRCKTAGSRFRFCPRRLQALQAYSWPGNMRELRNMVERLMLLATDGQVDLATVQLALPKAAGIVPPGVTASSGALADRVQSFEREVILAELKRSQHNVTDAAKSLGLERSHLYKKAEQLGIDLRALRREQGPHD